MKSFTSMMRNLWKDESGQGATEYILLLVVVVALGFMFKEKIMTVVEGKLGELGTSIETFK